MQIREVESGKVLAERKQDTLYLIVKGAAKVTYPGGSYRIQTGDVIGLCEMNREQPQLSYQIEEKVSLIVYSASYEQLQAQIEENPQAMKYFVSSFFRQLDEISGRCYTMQEEMQNAWQSLRELYEEYLTYCEKNDVPAKQLPGYAQLQEPDFIDNYPKWLGGYYATQEQMLAVWDHNITDYMFLYGFLTKAVEDIAVLLALSGRIQKCREALMEYFLNERGQDIFHKYVALYHKEAKERGSLSKEAMELKLKIKKMQDFIERQRMSGIFFSQGTWAKFEKTVKELKVAEQNITGNDYLKQQQMNELTGSLEQILKYAECEAQVETNFKKYVQAYKKLADKNASEDTVRHLRHELTTLFYKIYVEAFQASIAKKEIPPVLKMFFEFGYVDEELAGIDNALYLYQLVSNMQTNPERGVYSVYEWLMAIYKGEKEPGRNEFDLDYTEYLREQKKNGRLTAAQEATLINNPASKVMYEMEQVFPSVNKVTYGRPSVFCPIFSEHNILKPLNSALITAEKVITVLNEIRKIDYSAFYRETMYVEPLRGAFKEQIFVEVTPDIILTPNIGSRGIMWQEIEGKKRTTPARMMCSVFHVEDLRLTLVRLAAEFRWEMCKRIQGGRWNDITERSLTSEYCDYAQFYRKNRDLSADAKEKVKLQMIKCKNSYKEMFIYDYIQWVCFESTGVPKVNKVVREILFTYCPFSEPIRNVLMINPLYQEFVDRHKVKMGQKVHHLDNLYQKIRNEGREIPEEIAKYRRFVEA